jgi:hypothetical protein
MVKLPEPPDPLLAKAETTTLGTGTPLCRIYFRGGSHSGSWGQFRFFGPTQARFDHHDPPPRVQAKGILYAANCPVTCLAEVFQATRVVERIARDPWLVVFHLTRALVLLDLTGTWPTAAGASMAIGSGPRPRARRWSQSIYAAYPAVEGLLYCSSMHANQPAVALFERAQNALPSAPAFHRALADPGLLLRLNAAATLLGYQLP